MSDKASRYANCQTATLQVTDPEGQSREVHFLRRRFLPSAAGMTVVVQHTVTQGERLDNITARYLGDPTQFWRVCDANEVMMPEELEETGRAVKIAMPGL